MSPELGALLYFAIGLWTALTAAILFFAKSEIRNAREEGAGLAWFTFAAFLWPIAWVTLLGWVIGGLLAPRPRSRRPP